MKKSFTRILLVTIISVSSIVCSQAQYQKSFGIRIGKFATGGDLKCFFDASGNTAIELFGGFTQEANCGYLGKIFFLKQLSLRDPRLQLPLKMIFGVGSHVGFFKDPYYTIKDGQIFYYPENTFSIGIDGTFGLEYNTRKLPFTVGVDANPYYSFFNPGPTWIDFGINIRYIIQ
jgi:hypothetical protein